MTLIRVGHSPDPDDAFMFCATAHRRIDMGDYQFEHVMEDIQTLNEWAFEKKLEVTAVSLHAYAHLADDYALLAAGASLGQGYGPIFVTRPGVDAEEAFAGPVAVPGELTTAFLVARLYAGDFPYKVVPFDQILETVRSGQASAGLVIHEGQLTYADEGLELLVDLGKWWQEQTQLPLPLGVTIVQRSLGPERIAQVADILDRSIRYGLEHRDEALDYALQWGRGLDKDTCDRFVEMYVNDTTLDFGQAGRAAVRELFSRGHAAGIIPKSVEVDFVTA
ncbi:MAG: ABC transporter substrate-binding protein [Candidatus Eremiobacteraeota bacterium]|nr:ABC transporter substrate-binding protein [Candidatus Eremiobacteraeota bacterium]